MVALSTVLALSSVLSVARGRLTSIFFVHFTLHTTPMISFPHSPNDKERDNKNHYANSDGGEPIAVNPISCARTHAQSDNERDAQVHRHAWRSCGRPGCDVKGRRLSYAEFPHSLRRGYCVRACVRFLAPGAGSGLAGWTVDVRFTPESGHV